MVLNILDEQGNESIVRPSKHSIERFTLRYSLLYANILNKHYSEVKKLFKDMFNHSEQFTCEDYETRDKIRNRNNIYLKSGYLIFIISNDENPTIITVKCSPEFNELNSVKDNPQLRKILKQRDHEDRRFFQTGYEGNIKET